MVYYVIEFQTGDTGSVIPVAYTDRSLAFQKYHQIMSAASVSDVPKHGAMVITEDLYVFEDKKELAYREPVESEVPEE